MANNRLSMRKITEVLRLYFEHSRSKVSVSESPSFASSSIVRWF